MRRDANRSKDAGIEGETGASLWRPARSVERVTAPTRRVLGLAVVALVLVPPAGGSPPPGASAQCRDGTYSYSQHRSGTCSDHGGVAKWLDGSGASSPGSSSAGAVTVSLGRTMLLARRSRADGCVRGAEPDRRCSPGAYESKLTTVVICSSSFRTSAIRDVPQSEKFQVESEYGMRPSYYGYKIEIDHIVPLELGGSNVIANLFPEPGSGRANYHFKDALENRLHDLVCAGTITLRSARRGIAANWVTLYTRLFGSAPAR